jgi:hypothetical protein
MASNFIKLWVQKDQNAAAIKRAKQTVEITGKALPCRVVAVNGPIVTVAFEVDTAPWTLPQITIPKAESPYFRMPTQVGDLGVTVPADAYLGAVSGLGGGVAKLFGRGNLSSLVFLPVSNKNSPPDDPNKAQVMGPDGVIIRDEASTVVATVSGGQMAVDGNVFVNGNLGASTGVSGAITTITGQVATFTNGILTGLV